MTVSQKVVLHYPPFLTEKPVVYGLVKKYNIMFNILKASFSADDKEGLLVLELSGTSASLKRGLGYLHKLGVKTELLSQDIIRFEDKCVHCGVCSAVCPTNAFYFRAPEMLVELEITRCIGCEECFRVCPYRAIEISFKIKP